MIFLSLLVFGYFVSIIFVQVARSVKIDGYEANDRYTYWGERCIFGWKKWG